MSSPKKHPIKKVIETVKSDEFKTVLTYGQQRKKTILTDLFNSMKEYRAYRHVRKEINKAAPHGDGHPVLVIPGFAENDLFTKPLRHALKKNGYKAYGWKGHFNIGMKEKAAANLAERLKEVYEANGHKKVSVIGHSLGGIYARALAQEFPDMVRDVITIETPFGLPMTENAKDDFLISTIMRLSDKKVSLDNPGMPERLLTPPPVPTTSIFSKVDTFWRTRLNPISPQSENIEITATHIGSVWHKDSIAIILNRLAQPEGQWQQHKDHSHAKPPKNPRWKPGNDDSWKIFPKL